jgi:hypothetical protein
MNQKTPLRGAFFTLIAKLFALFIGFSPRKAFKYKAQKEANCHQAGNEFGFHSVSSVTLMVVYFTPRTGIKATLLTGLLSICTAFHNRRACKKRPHSGV